MRFRVYGVYAIMHDSLVKCIFRRVFGRALHGLGTEVTLRVGVVLAEEILRHCGCFAHAQFHHADFFWRCGSRDESVARTHAFDFWSLRIVAPRPGVAKEQLRNHMNIRSFWPAIHHFNAHCSFITAALDVSNPHFKEAIVIQHACVEQLKLGFEFGAHAILCNKRVVGKRALRIGIHHAIERVRRHRILVKPQLFRVFAVIAF